MDGWETRRRRTPGHDWCVLLLGLRGRIRGVDVDTSYFVGNHPEQASLDACDLPGRPTRGQLERASLGRDPARLAARAGRSNLFALTGAGPFTHVRLNIFPDGGVARLRVHGEVVADPATAARPPRRPRGDRERRDRSRRERHVLRLESST